jgi:hypothetical protein
VEAREEAREAREEIEAAARERLTPEAAQAVVADLRPAIALEVEGDGVDAGRYGGLPPLPDGVPWPEYDGAPMTLLVQLDCAALAPLLGGEWTLPRAGRLLFFYEETFFAEPDDGCRVLHVPDGCADRAAPAGTVVIPALPLTAWAFASLPTYYAPHMRERWDLDAVDAMDERRALADVDPDPDHRVLGWPRDPYEERKGYRLLLSVEAEQGTAWGECVAMAFWVPEEDLPTGRLDRVRRVLDVA